MLMVSVESLTLPVDMSEVRRRRDPMRICKRETRNPKMKHTTPVTARKILSFSNLPVISSHDCNVCCIQVIRLSKTI